MGQWSICWGGILRAEETAMARGNVVNLRPWRPGQSGNPGGRAKYTPEQRETLRQLRELTPEVSKFVRWCFEEGSKGDKKWAIEKVLSRYLPIDEALAEAVAAGGHALVEHLKALADEAGAG